MKGVFLLLLILMLNACSNEDKVNLNVKHPDIFAQYDINAEDGNTMATCLVRFYKDKSRRVTLDPEEYKSVELDGNEISIDSSRFSGVFYEVQIPVSEFEGKHTLTFTSKDNQQYKENFSFVPVKLLTDLNDPVSKATLILEMEGLQPNDKVRLVMIDTAFVSEGINQVEAVKNGQLVIEDRLLSTLKSGPVILEISKESETPLTSGLNGIITATYTIRRSLFLKD